MHFSKSRGKRKHVRKRDGRRATKRAIDKDQENCSEPARLKSRGDQGASGRLQVEGMLLQALGCRCRALRGLRLSPRPAQSRSQSSPPGFHSICQPARGLMSILKSWCPRNEQDLPVLTHQSQSSWAPGSQRPLSPRVSPPQHLPRVQQQRSGTSLHLAEGSCSSMARSLPVPVPRITQNH